MSYMTVYTVWNLVKFFPELENKVMWLNKYMGFQEQNTVNSIRFMK